MHVNWRAVRGGNRKPLGPSACRWLLELYAQLLFHGRRGLAFDEESLPLITLPQFRPLHDQVDFAGMFFHQSRHAGIAGRNNPETFEPGAGFAQHLALVFALSELDDLTGSQFGVAAITP